MPPGVHYDLWMGPAPERPFNEHRFHYYWHWFWDYGTGDLGNTARAHARRHALAAWQAGASATAYCSGGTYEAGAPTDQQTPNTQSATYRYADGTELHCDLRNWFSGPPEARGVFVYGSKGWMKVGDDKARCTSDGRTNQVPR